MANGDENRPGPLRKYRRREMTPVVAVRFDLDTDGFTYRKWGGEQRCKRGDWIVNRDDDTYTVDGEEFARTYRPVGGGLYEKTAPVWAVEATEPGTIRTREGTTDYQAGDYLVFEGPDADIGYAISRDRFRTLYEAED